MIPFDTKAASSCRWNIPAGLGGRGCTKRSRVLCPHAPHPPPRPRHIRCSLGFGSWEPCSVPKIGMGGSRVGPHGDTRTIAAGCLSPRRIFTALLHHFFLVQSPLGICCTLTRPAAPPIFLSLSPLPFKKEKRMENAWRRHGHRPVKGAKDAAWSPSGWFCGWEGAQSTPHFFLSFLYIQTYIPSL